MAIFFFTSYTIFDFIFFILFHVFGIFWIVWILGILHAHAHTSFVPLFHYSITRARAHTPCGRRVWRSHVNSHPEITPVNVCSIGRFSDRAIISASGCNQIWETCQDKDEVKRGRETWIVKIIGIKIITLSRLRLLIIVLR